MAARLPDGNVQAMQQFVGQSSWEWLEVWARLGKRMTAELEPDSARWWTAPGFPNMARIRWAWIGSIPGPWAKPAIAR